MVVCRKSTRSWQDQNRLIWRSSGDRWCSVLARWLTGWWCWLAVTKKRISTSSRLSRPFPTSVNRGFERLYHFCKFSPTIVNLKSSGVQNYDKDYFHFIILNFYIEIRHRKCHVVDVTVLSLTKSKFAMLERTQIFMCQGISSVMIELPTKLHETLNFFNKTANIIYKKATRNLCNVV